ncbi:MAG: site-specific integrase [Actinomycetota bacterium]
MSIHRRETKNGTRWDVRLRDPSGKGYAKTFRTKREAQAFERNELAARDQGTWVDPRDSKQTVGEWVATWYPVHEEGLAPKTAAQYQSTLNRWILPAIGHRRLSSITPLELQGLVNSWAAEAKPSTVQHRFAILRTILMAAVKEDILVRSPCRSVKLPRKESRRRKPITPEELHRLTESIVERYRPMVWLGAILGMRWGEVAGLRVGSLDMGERRLWVTETVGEANGIMHFGPPKSAAGRRSLPIPEAVANILDAHLRSEGLTEVDSDVHLFRAVKGGPLRHTWWHPQVWVPARDAIGRPDIGFHDLRRLYASGLVDAGVDVKVSQELMGHEDIRLTRGLYAQAASESKRTANEAIATRLLGSC